LSFRDTTKQDMNMIEEEQIDSDDDA